jgi:WD40 repeat protein
MNGYAATLHGHTSSVFSAAFSPNQRLLASGDGDDHTVRLWDVTDLVHPRPVGQPLTDHTTWVLDIAFTPDGHTMATASSTELILWNVDEPDHPRKLATIGTDETVEGFVDALGISFNPTGDLLISTHGGVVRLWDVRDPAKPTKLGRSFGKHTNDISDVAYSPDGRVMALTLTESNGQNDRRNSVLWLYDATSPPFPQFRSQWQSDKGRLTALAFVPKKPILVTVSEGEQFDDSGSVILWNVSDPAKAVQIGTPLPAHTAGVEDVAVSPDGATLTTVSSDATAINWDITNPAAPRQIGDPLTDHTNGVHAVAYRADGTMVTGSADNNLMLWHAGQSSPVQPTMRGLPDLHKEITGLAFAPDRRVLATASDSGEAALWDVTDPAHPKGPTMLTDHRKTISAFAFRSDGTMLATGSSNGGFGRSGSQEILFWDVRDPANPHRVGPTLEGPSHDVVTLQFSADGDSLWAATSNVSIIRWDITDLDHPQRTAEIMKEHDDFQTSVAFRPDFHAVASVRGFDTDEVGIRDITDPTHAKLLEQPVKHQAAAAMLFGPDGRWMVSGGIDVLLWDISTAWRPQQMGLPLGAGKYIRSLALNADGTILGAGYLDGGISVWDIGDRRRPHRIGAKMNAAHSNQGETAGTELGR